MKAFRYTVVFGALGLLLLFLLYPLSLVLDASLRMKGTGAVTLFAPPELYKQGEATWTQDAPIGATTV